MDADQRGGWTQFFGGKASEPDSVLPVEKRNFYPPHLHLAAAPPLLVIISEFRRDLLHRKTGVPVLSCGFIFEILRLAVLIQYRLVTDGQTDGHAMTA